MHERECAKFLGALCTFSETPRTSGKARAKALPGVKHGKWRSAMAVSLSLPSIFLFGGTRNRHASVDYGDSRGHASWSIEPAESCPSSLIHREKDQRGHDREHKIA